MINTQLKDELKKLLISQGMNRNQRRSFMRESDEPKYDGFYELLHESMTPKPVKRYRK